MTADGAELVCTTGMEFADTSSAGTSSCRSGKNLTLSCLSHPKHNTYSNIEYQLRLPLCTHVRHTVRDREQKGTKVVGVDSHRALLHPFTKRRCSLLKKRFADTTVVSFVCRQNSKSSHVIPTSSLANALNASTESRTR
jgi:hypothetical protein